jgi:hypothetical protein
MRSLTGLTKSNRPPDASRRRASWGDRSPRPGAPNCDKSTGDGSGGKSGPPGSTTVPDGNTVPDGIGGTGIPPVAYVSRT